MGSGRRDCGGPGRTQYSAPTGDCRRQCVALLEDFASPLAHMNPPRLVFPQSAEHTRQTRIISASDADSDFGLCDESCQFTVRVADEDYRPSGCEDAIELARYDQPLELGTERDQMHVARGEAVGQGLSRLVRRKAEIREAPRARLHLERAHAGPAADHQKRDTRVTLECARGLQDRIGIMCATEIAGVCGNEL